jgi:hypothetical protein
MKKEFNFSNGCIIIYAENDDFKIKVRNKAIHRAKYLILERTIEAFAIMKLMVDFYPPKDAFIATLKEEELILPSEEDYSDFYDTLVSLSEKTYNTPSNIPQIPSTPPVN